MDQQQLFSSNGSEEIKHHSEDFGGHSTWLMTPQQVQARICVAKYCGRKGFTQLLVPDHRPKYWIVCKQHMVLANLVIAMSIGHPDAIGEAKRIAGLVQLDWSAFLRARPSPEPCLPKDFRCLECGGQMSQDQGNNGRIYYHNCQEFSDGNPV